MSQRPPTAFERAARTESRRGFAADFWGFLRQHRKWWMLPLVLLFLLLGSLLVLGGTGFAPFVYTFF